MNQEASFSILPFDWPDEQAVVALWQTCNLVVPWNDPHRDIRLKMDFQPCLFLIGKLEDRIIATVMAGYEGHRGWINYLAVHPDFQKQGFGRKLMNAAEEKLKELGCVKINLQVRETNRQVIDFYQAIGYKVDPVLSLGKRL